MFACYSRSILIDGTTTANNLLRAKRLEEVEAEKIRLEEEKKAAAKV